MDKAELLKKRTGETREVEIPGVGTVTVRGLSAGEVKRWKGKSESEVERHVIAAAMVDPVLTLDEVDEWAENAPFGHLVDVIKAVYELSGVSEGAAKSGLPGVGKRRRR